MVPAALCYFLARDGRLTLAEVAEGASRLAVMNAIVDTYNAWGSVERTLLTDVDGLLAQFPQLVAVAVFPPVSYTHLDVYKRQVLPTSSF